MQTIPGIIIENLSTTESNISTCWLEPLNTDVFSIWWIVPKLRYVAMVKCQMQIDCECSTFLTNERLDWQTIAIARK